MRTLLTGDERPHGLDYVVALIALLLAVFEAIRLCAVDDPREPFAAYDADPGIRLIWMTAIAADLTLPAAVVAWELSAAWTARAQLTIRAAWTARAQLAMVVAAAIAGLAPWAELWWGAAPAYGGVRDKMGLPWTVVHWGPVGALFFATYLVLRARIPLRRSIARCFTRASLFAVAWCLQLAVFLADRNHS